MMIRDDYTNPAFWGSVWADQMALASRKWEDEHFWYQRTQLPPIGVKTSNYADELIKRMALSPESTVLDIGCGDGAITMRIAQKVKQVTALDANPKLLFPITQRIMAEGITNLKFINTDWLETRIGTEINQQDIVIASRFRQILNLQKFLEQMHAAAIARCYFTWIAEREEMDAKIFNILGNEYHSLPDYSIIVNMLNSIGISANIDFFDTTETHRFDSETEAIDDTLRGFRVADVDVLQRITQLAISGLEHKQGCLWRNTPAKWALISWSK